MNPFAFTTSLIGSEQGEGIQGQRQPATGRTARLLVGSSLFCKNLLECPDKHGGQPGSEEPFPRAWVSYPPCSLASHSSSLQTCGQSTLVRVGWGACGVLCGGEMDSERAEDTDCLCGWQGKESRAPGVAGLCAKASGAPGVAGLCARPATPRGGKVLGGSC